jgi:hypothetical protein
VGIAAGHFTSAYLCSYPAKFLTLFVGLRAAVFDTAVFVPHLLVLR